MGPRKRVGNKCIKIKRSTSWVVIRIGIIEIYLRSYNNIQTIMRRKCHIVYMYCLHNPLYKHVYYYTYNTV